MYIIAYGNVFEGMGFIGPFNTAEEAIEYAEHRVKNVEWHVGTLQETL